MSRRQVSPQRSRRELLTIAGVVGLGALTSGCTTEAAGFAHPGLLHTQADIDRMKAKVAAGAQPWKAGWDVLVANPHSHPGWRPKPAATVVRGGSGQNYHLLFHDIAAAYQNALRFRISGDPAHGDTARDILNAWSHRLRGITGSSDRYLAAGIYGYQFANAAEIMRGYPGFDLAAFRTMMLDVFYPVNNDFLTRHNGQCVSHYWANWDLCNMASLLAIGILCDDRAKVDQATSYFTGGAGNGSIAHAIPFVYPDAGLAQWQESGRDQGHTLFGIGLMGAFCQMAWNQGIDLFSFDANRFQRACEYVATYNLGHDVPFTRYTWGNGSTCTTDSQTVISPGGRGQSRPVWELVYNHFAVRQRASVPGIAAMAAKGRPEGGGGDYGTNSGGFDSLGFGTLTCTL